MSILDEIFVHKRSEVENRRLKFPIDEIKEQALQTIPAVDFCAALRRTGDDENFPALIAEVKHRSPSRGILAPDFDPVGLARIYAENGAAAISVLTDKYYFGGHLDYLKMISEESLGVPLLRKDFIFDPYQVYEARMAGADAILLIAAALGAEQLCSLNRLAIELGMTALIEVHDQEELQLALTCEPSLIGINNRNLHDFSVNLDVTLRLRSYIPQDVMLVSESGIRSQNDLERLVAAGINAVLIGEALVTSQNIAASVRGYSRGRLAV